MAGEGGSLRKGHAMKEKRDTDGQMVYALKQAGGVQKVTDRCRRMGMAEALFTHWTKRFSASGVAEIRERRHPHEENAQWWLLVASRCWDKPMPLKVIATQV